MTTTDRRAAPPSALNAAILSSAADDGRLTVGRWAALFAGEDVAVAPVDNAVVVLVPDEPMRRPRLARTPRSSVTGGLRWEGAEHTYLGDQATLHFASGNTPAAKTPLHLPNGLALTYGQIVALGGDFFGLPDAPISDDPKPPARFLAAFGTLANQAGAIADVPRILQIMQTEIDAVNQAIKQGKQPSTVYAALGDSLNKQYNVATGGGSVISDLWPMGRFLQLALTNWDHFGTHAMAAYTMGHRAAMAQAIAARTAPDAAATRSQLELAYAMNAFADHFLTDLFSSGHLRTPREELYHATAFGPIIGSHLAKFMHDEDSCWGLTVQNDLGRQWTAYGDKKLLDTVNTVNAGLVEQAVQTSVDEIYDAYTTGIPQPLVPLHMTPQLQPLWDWRQRTNPAALFIYDGQTVSVRSDLTNRSDYDWTSVWNGFVTERRLSALAEFQTCGNTEIPIDLQANIVQLWDNGGRLGMIVYGPAHEHAYAVTWRQDDMGEASAAVAWLSITENEQTSIIQLMNRDGRLAMVVYAPTASGGYVVRWRSSNLREGPWAVAWLPVRSGGRTQIAQLWNNNGALGMIVYAPTDQGGYQVVWRNTNVGQGPWAVAWFACDLGDQQTHIVQLWDNGGTLGMIVYAPDGAGGFTVGWSNPNMGQGSGALAWQSIENGGQTHLLQLWDAGDTLGLIVYSPNGAGGYAVSRQVNFAAKFKTVGWVTADLDGSGTEHLVQLIDRDGRLGMVIYYWPFTGSPYLKPDLGEGPWAVAWLTCDAGDETTDIVQLWDNHGQLGMVVYAPTGTGAFAEYRVSGHTDNLGEGSGALAFFTSALPLP